jgi:hypothetical protein
VPEASTAPEAHGMNTAQGAREASIAAARAAAIAAAARAPSTPPDHSGGKP